MSALSRRSLLAAFSAVAGTGVSGVTPKAALAAVAAVGASEGDSGVPVYGSVEPVCDESSTWEITRPVRNQLYKLAREFDGHILPPSRYSTKKSWSQSFKEAQARKDYDRIQAAINSLENDKVAHKVLAALGIEVPA